MLVISHIIRANRIYLMSLTGPMSGGWPLLTHSGFSHMKLKPTGRHNCLLSIPARRCLLHRGCWGAFYTHECRLQGLQLPSPEHVGGGAVASVGLDGPPGGQSSIGGAAFCVCAEPSALCLGAYVQSLLPRAWVQPGNRGSGHGRQRLE